MDDSICAHYYYKKVLYVECIEPAGQWIQIFYFYASALCKVYTRSSRLLSSSMKNRKTIIQMNHMVPKHAWIFHISWSWLLFVSGIFLRNRIFFSPKIENVHGRTSEVYRLTLLLISSNVKTFHTPMSKIHKFRMCLFDTRFSLKKCLHNVSMLIRFMLIETIFHFTCLTLNSISNAPFNIKHMFRCVDWQFN